MSASAASTSGGAVPWYPRTLVVTSSSTSHNDDGHADHDHGAQTSWTCDGTPWIPFKASTWAVHVQCGILLLLWGLHWACGTFKAYATSSRQRPYRSRPTYPVAVLPASWPVEGVLKVAVPVVAILMELWWNNHGSWRNLVCSVNSGKERLRYGHLAVDNIYAWQNAMVLLVFMMSGVVDLLAEQWDLPAFTQEFFLGSAFLLEGFGLANNEFPNGLEAMLYYLIYLLAMATALTIFLQAANPGSFFLGAARAFTTLGQGVWMIAIARFMYEGHAAWETMTPTVDMAPEMLVPVVFVGWLNFVSFAMFILFLAVRWWYTAKLPDDLKAACAVERTLDYTPAAAHGNGAGHVHHSGSAGSTRGASLSGGGAAGGGVRAVGEGLLEMKALGKPATSRV